MSRYSLFIAQYLAPPSCVCGGQHKCSTVTFRSVLLSAVEQTVDQHVVLLVKRHRSTELSRSLGTGALAPSPWTCTLACPKQVLGGTQLLSIFSNVAQRGLTASTKRFAIENVITQRVQTEHPQNGAAAKFGCSNNVLEGQKMVT